MLIRQVSGFNTIMNPRSSLLTVNNMMQNLKNGTGFKINGVRCKNVLCFEYRSTRIRMTALWEGKSCTTENKNKISIFLCVLYFIFTLLFQRKEQCCLACDEMHLQWLTSVYYLP